MIVTKNFFDLDPSSFDEFLQVTTTLHLKSLRVLLERQMRKSIDGATELNNNFLDILRIAEKYELHVLMQEIMDKKLLSLFSDMESTQFKELSKPIKRLYHVGYREEEITR